MVFNLEQFKNEYVAINCQTQEEATAFLDYLNKLGIEECKDKENYLSWEDLGKETCYVYGMEYERVVHFGVYAHSTRYLRGKAFVIIPYSALKFEEIKGED